ncbi:hypothetical protein IKQ74_01985 [Candidatus Saccharibacteria bacterium]|nr:hypothetical protein [Candidatus Saccharibacteria bacterium]
MTHVRAPASFVMTGKAQNETKKTKKISGAARKCHIDADIPMMAAARKTE